MADRLGVSTGTISNLLRRHPEYKPRDISSRLHLVTPEVIQSYENGEPLQDIAKRLGLSVATLRSYFLQKGVRLRTKKEASILMGAAKKILLDLDQIRLLRSQEMTTREIAEVLGAHEETVRSRMVEAGIPRLEARARTEHNAFWNGGLSVDKAGYILARTPEHPNRTAGGYVRLHRLVMERHLDRLLTSEEVVDHLDGDTSDNRIRNLVLYPSNAEHLRATLRGRHSAEDRLPRDQREQQRRAAVQRALDRVEAIHRERGSGERLSLSELDQWIDELATGAPTP